MCEGGVLVYFGKDWDSAANFLEPPRVWANPAGR